MKNKGSLEKLKEESLLLKLVGRQIIVREGGKGIHIFLECPVVQNPHDDDPYMIKEYSSDMRTKEGKPFILCVWCKEILERGW
jgi:hypothetical protein